MVPAIIAPLISGLAIWSVFGVRAVQRAAGRKAVEAELARLGERAVAIEDAALHGLPTAGLVAGHVFRVDACDAKGAAITHLWAYEPGQIRTQRPQKLKRLAHGIWIPA
jgi:hypothetical protein